MLVTISALVIYHAHKTRANYTSQRSSKTTRAMAFAWPAFTEAAGAAGAAWFEGAVIASRRFSIIS